MGLISNIYEGWSLYATGKTPQFTKDRAKVCESCPSAVEGTYEKLMPDDTLENVQGLKCNECGCPLSTLLRSKNKKCELNKW